MSTKLPDASYWILCALGQGEAHGYLLAQRIAELTDDVVRPGPGTLYGALERLAGDGLVEQSGDEVVDGRNRRYYRLTASGRAAVVDETRRRSAAVNRAAISLGLA